MTVSLNVNYLYVDVLHLVHTLSESKTLRSHKTMINDFILVIQYMFVNHIEMW